MIIFLIFTVIIFDLIFHKTRNSKYKQFSSPGPCVPILGHTYKMMTEKFRRDPIHELWNIYKEHQRNGMMYFNTFGYENLYIGDFEAVKRIFNHADGNGRFDHALEEWGKLTR